MSGRGEAEATGPWAVFGLVPCLVSHAPRCEPDPLSTCREESVPVRGVRQDFLFAHDLLAGGFNPAGCRFDFVDRNDGHRGMDGFTKLNSLGVRT